MISHDQLIYAIEQETGLTHGPDFLVAHPLDKNGNQAGDAYMFRWITTEVDRPDIELMKAAFYERYCDGYAAKVAREKRDFLITQTDWSQSPDVPAAQRELYVAYRQALRDLTDQAGFPNSIDWPALPQ